ncbi:MAG: MOFRL family protein, partial [Pseudomonadota bacterium]
ALETLQDLGVWADIPANVQAYLQQAPRSVPAPNAKNILIGSNPISVSAMAKALPHATHHQTALEGNVTKAAPWIAGLPPGAHVFGGETTVTLTGTGKGGRNQDLALRVALLAEEQGWDGDWLYLQGGTDGRDGPTDAAGGVVHQGTLAAIRAACIDPAAALANNDAYTALKAADALLMTGGTGTNVADLGVLIRG